MWYGPITYNPIILLEIQGYFLIMIKIMIFLPSLLTSSISKILVALESAVSLKDKIRNKKMKYTRQTAIKSLPKCKEYYDGS